MAVLGQMSVLMAGGSGVGPNPVPASLSIVLITPG